MILVGIMKVNNSDTHENYGFLLLPVLKSLPEILGAILYKTNKAIRFYYII